MIKSVRFLCVEGFRARVIIIALLFTVKAYSYSPSARGVPGRFALCLERLSSLVKLLIYPLIGKSYIIMYFTRYIPIPKSLYYLIYQHQYNMHSISNSRLDGIICSKDDFLSNGEILLLPIYRTIAFHPKK